MFERKDAGDPNVDLSPEHSSAWTGHCNVLLVDDDLELREAIQDELAERGFNVRAAGDGSTALETLQEWKADVIVLDLYMPSLDGWQFRVRQRLDPELSQIPVVAMSADDGAKAAAISSDAFIAKPFSPDRLVEIIEQVVVGADNDRTSVERLAECTRLATLGMMSASLVHEINNSLTAVLASVDLGEKGLARLASSLGHSRELAEIESDVHESSVAAKRIRTIVQDVRSFSRPVDDQLGPVEIRRVLEASARLAWPQIRGRARFVKDYGELPAVHGNESKIGQVLLNLLVNAAQAIPDGQAETNEIRVSARAQNDGALRIEVKDTGCGMSQRTLDRLFRPFFSTKSAEGTGLGLYVSSRLCRQMGARLDVRSVLGQGSTFGLSFDAARALQASD